MTTIPFIDLKSQYALIKDAVNDGIRRVLEHGQYIMGPEVEQCERKLVEFTGARHCLTVSSGTDAILAPLMALGIGPGDAVFVPSFTFTATVEVVLLLGATPVYVDSDPRLFNLDAADLARRIERVTRQGRLKPRAVIAVDLFGIPADYPALSRICEPLGLTVIADAAQSFGAALGNKRVGALAPITTTSFFPAKPLGCYGDGGAILFEDESLLHPLTSIRVHGQGKTKYEVERVGLNARFDTIQAAIIIEKLKIFEDELAARDRLARRYTELLDGAVETPVVPEGSRSSWAQYSILSDRRDEIAAALVAEGIPTAIYYPVPMHLQPVYREHGSGVGDCPVAERLSRRVLSLPMHPYLREAQVERTADAVRRSARA